MSKIFQGASRIHTTSPETTKTPGGAGHLTLSTELATEIATSPRAAVIEAWIAVEQELESVAEAAGINQERARSGTFALLSELRRRSIIELTRGNE